MPYNIMSRKAVKGVLHNFLETYTSRYSDYDGYWLFGLLVADLKQFSVDLLETDSETFVSAPLTAARRLAAAKFKEQMEKAGLRPSCLLEARLTVTRAAGSRTGPVNGQRSNGFDLNFAARAIFPDGRMYECEKSVFVAPHDPGVELRSARGT